MQPKYEEDFHAWLDDQISFMRNKDFTHLDMDHLIEEMEELGGSYKNALESHLTIMLIHMLKKNYQKDYSSKSWNDSIDNGRVQIDKIIRKNPSLKNYISLVFSECYQDARRYASSKQELRSNSYLKSVPGHWMKF